MPSMIRPKGKARAIAYALLGVPENMRSKRRRRKKAPAVIEQPMIT